MFEKKIKNFIKVDRNFAVSQQDLAREEFFDRTDRKVFDTNVQQEYLGYKLLLDINLEEKRGKLRRLLEENENNLTEEHLSKIETLETRIKNLKEQAIRIRKQTELERQILADSKRTQTMRLNDDQIRSKQSLQHFKTIYEDWDKLKEIKNHIKREEDCEEKFWLAKKSEMIDNLIRKENIIKNKKNAIKDDFQKQIKITEKQRQINREEKAENQNYLNEMSKEVDKQLAEENTQAKQNKAMKQINYHKILDNQIRIKKAIHDKNKSAEDTFQLIMKDENLQKININKFKNQLALCNNFKSFTNFIKYQDCLKKMREEEEKEINVKVLKTQMEIHRKNYEREKEKVKEFLKLISEIKIAQKDQLMEASKLKDFLTENKIKDREFFNKVYEESLKEHRIKLENERKKNESHLQLFKQQLVFNEGIRNFNKSERERERKSMIAAEKNYLDKVNEILSKEQLQFLHPWRSH